MLADLGVPEEHISFDEFSNTGRSARNRHCMKLNLSVTFGAWVTPTAWTIT